MSLNIVEQLHVNDTPLITLTFLDPNVTPPTAHDISGFSTLSIVFLKPDGTSVTKTASFKTDGTDGKISYQLLKAELDQAGWWEWWGVIESASLKYRSNHITREVFPE